MGWIKNIFGLVTGAFSSAGLWIYVAIGMAISAASFTAGWKVDNWRHAQNELDNAKAVIRQAEKQKDKDADLTNKRINDALAYQAKTNPFLRKVADENFKNPSPVICNVTDDRMLQFDAAINAANATR